MLQLTCPIYYTQVHWQWASQPDSQLHSLTEVSHFKLSRRVHLFVILYLMPRLGLRRSRQLHKPYPSYYSQIVPWYPLGSSLRNNLSIFNIPSCLALSKMSKAAWLSPQMSEAVWLPLMIVRGCLTLSSMSEAAWLHLMIVRGCLASSSMSKVAWLCLQSQ